MKKEFENYLGEYFAKGVKNLENEGYILEKEEIKPYEDMTPSGKKRIINIKIMNKNKLKIIWSYEDYD